MAIWFTPSRLRRELQARVRSLASRIARTGAVCRCTTFPDCLGGAYESGDFLGTDLFCPLRACEVLGGAAGPTLPQVVGAREST